MTSGDGEWLFGIQELYRPAKEPDVEYVYTAILEF